MQKNDQNRSNSDEMKLKALFLLVDLQKCKNTPIRSVVGAVFDKISVKYISPPKFFKQLIIFQEENALKINKFFLYFKTLFL